MIRHLINGVQVIETIKPVIAGDEGMVSGRVFEPCHCVREMMMDKKIGADPALALRAEPASRLSASRSDQGERAFGDNGSLANAGFAAAPRFLNVNATELLAIYEAMKAVDVPDGEHSEAIRQGEEMRIITGATAARCPIDESVRRVLSLLLHIEQEALASVQDYEADVLALQTRRVNEIRHLFERATVAVHQSAGDR